MFIATGPHARERVPALHEIFACPLLARVLTAHDSIGPHGWPAVPLLDDKFHVARLNDLIEEDTLDVVAGHQAGINTVHRLDADERVWELSVAGPGAIDAVLHCEHGDVLPAKAGF